MPSASRSSVAQFSISAGQLIKLIKSVSSLVYEKSHYYSPRFSSKKRRLKIGYSGVEAYGGGHIWSRGVGGGEINACHQFCLNTPDKT